MSSAPVVLTDVFCAFARQFWANKTVSKWKKKEKEKTIVRRNKSREIIMVLSSIRRIELLPYFLNIVYQEFITAIKVANQDIEA